MAEEEKEVSSPLTKEDAQIFTNSILHKMEDLYTQFSMARVNTGIIAECAEILVKHLSARERSQKRGSKFKAGGQKKKRVI